MSEEFLRRRALEHVFLDSLGTAERVTGKPYAEDKATSALGFAIHLQNSRMKHSILSELGDTYLDISWQAFLEIIDDLGFDIIEDRQFAYDTGDGRVRYPGPHILKIRQTVRLPGRCLPDAAAVLCVRTTYGRSLSMSVRGWQRASCALRNR